MSGCSKVVATLLAILTVVLMAVLILVHTLVQTARNVTVVQEAVNVGYIERPVLASLLATLVEEAVADRFTATNFTTSDMEPFVDLIPSEWLDEVADNVIVALYNYLETGDPAQAQVEVDLQWLLIALNTDEGLNRLENFLNSLPVCEQGINFTRKDGRLFPYELCNPLTEDEMSIYNARQVIRNIAFNNPAMNNYVLSFPLFDGRVPQEWVNVQQWYSLTPFIWLLWLVPLLLLGVITLLTIYTREDFGRWMGYPVLWAGVMALLITVVIRFFLGAFIDSPTFVSTNEVDLGEAILSIALQAVKSFSMIWLWRTGWIAAAFIAVGVVLLVVTKLSNRLTTT